MIGLKRTENNPNEKIKQSHANFAFQCADNVTTELTWKGPIHPDIHCWIWATLIEKNWSAAQLFPPPPPLHPLVLWWFDLFTICNLSLLDKCKTVSRVETFLSCWISAASHMLTPESPLTTRVKVPWYIVCVYYVI